MFGFFKSKSVDSIIADIQTRIAQLHVVADLHAEAEKLHNQEIAIRVNLANLAKAEYIRAARIAAQFSALIS